MEKIKYISAFLLIAFFALSCKNEKNPEIKTVEIETESIKEWDPNMTFARAEFTIDGMTCAIGCAAQIQKKIAQMDGIKSAVVDFDKKLAMVEYNEDQVTHHTLEEAVSHVSETYKVSDMKNVDTFSKDLETIVCEPGCEKECCKGLKEGEEMTCKPDCKMACCVKKEA